MAHRFLTNAAAWLRFAAANLQAVPLTALILVVGATTTHVFLLPDREAAIEAAERRLAGLERNARRVAVERQVEQVSPVEARLHLLTRFPSEPQLNATLARLIEIAKAQGLEVPSGDYRLAANKDGPLDRYVLNLPVKGAYLTVRRYVAAVRAEFPDLAVDDISLRRENIGTGEVEAQLRFIAFGRKVAA